MIISNNEHEHGWKNFLYYYISIERKVTRVDILY